MSERTVTNSDSRGPRKINIYDEFVKWSALPPSERIKQGIETQEQFVEFYNIGINTPTYWKKQPNFKSKVRELRAEWTFGKTGAVLEGVYRSAMKGSTGSQKLFLELSGELPGKNKRIEDEQKYEPVEVLPPRDLRSFIDEIFPEPLKTKYNDLLNEMLIDADALNKGVNSITERSILIYEEEKKLIEKFRETAHPEDLAFYL